MKLQLSRYSFWRREPEKWFGRLGFAKECNDRSPKNIFWQTIETSFKGIAALKIVVWLSIFGAIEGLANPPTSSVQPPDSTSKRPRFYLLPPEKRGTYDGRKAARLQLSGNKGSGSQSSSSDSSSGPPPDSWPGSSSRDDSGFDSKADSNLDSESNSDPMSTRNSKSVLESDSEEDDNSGLNKTVLNSVQNQMMAGTDCAMPPVGGAPLSVQQKIPLTTPLSVVRPNLINRQLALIRLKKCCQSISRQDIKPTHYLNIALGSEDRDPYMLGSADVHPSIYYGAGLDTLDSFSSHFQYKMEVPAEIGKTSVIPEDLTMSILRRGPNEHVNHYIKRRLRQVFPKNKYGDLNHVLTKAGAGSLSEVYYLHSPRPPNNKLKELYSDAELKSEFPKLSPMEARKMKWAKQNVIEVVKVRSDTPFKDKSLSPSKALADSAEFLRRDLGLSTVFSELANTFEYTNLKGEKEQLISFSSYRVDPNELKFGIIRQPVVRGRPAKEIAKMVLQGEQLDASSKEYLIAQFGSLAEARRKMQAVSYWYHITTPYVVAYSKKNGFKLMNGRVYRRKDGTRNLDNIKNPNIRVDVGFDEIQGGNLIWSEDLRQFVGYDL